MSIYDDPRNFSGEISRHIRAKEKNLIWIGVAIGWVSCLVTVAMLIMLYVVAKS